MLFKSSSASLTVTVLVLASTALSTDTNTVSNLDIALDLRTYAHGCANNLMSCTAGIVGGTL
jgi:hypothetical protein